MIRVVHIISGDLWAGAEVMTFNLLRGLLSKKELDIFAVILNEGRLSRELRNLGVNVIILDERDYSFIDLGFKLYRLLKKIKPNIIHSHRYKENMLSFFNSSIGAGGQMIVTQHGMPEIYNVNTSIKHKVLIWFNFFIMKNTFDYIVCVSHDIKKRFIEQFGISEKKLSVIHNGVDVPKTVFISKQEGPFRIGTAGRMFPVKDFPLFITIAHRILQVEKNVRFFLAGEGPAFVALQKQVNRFNISENFKFLGHVENMASFYRPLDLYMNTSIHEGIPMSVLEAMAFGVPVVGPGSGGLCEIIENSVSGFLIDSREPGNFANVCLKIIQEPNLRGLLSKGARERVITCFSTEHMAKCYFRLYQEISSN